jgi:hypothetical protein
VLTILGQRHGSSRTILPTNARTALESNNTSMAHSRHSMPEANRSGSSMDEFAQKTASTDSGPVGKHVDTGVEK